MREEHNARIAKIRKEVTDLLIRDRLIAEADANWVKFIEKQPYHKFLTQTTPTDENKITSTNENKPKPTDENHTQ